MNGTPLSPRQKLTPVPYALYALDSPASGVGNTLDQAYDQGGPGVGRTITADNGAVQILGPGGLEVLGWGDTHILRGENASPTSGASGVAGLATAISGYTYGGYFENASMNGTGVLGRASADFGGFTFGGYFESASMDGTGVYGIALGADGGYTWGGQFVTYSADGTGVYGEGSTFGVQGNALGALGCGVEGVGAARGVSGHSQSSTGGEGVYGFADAVIDLAYGGRFECISTSGRGVEGLAFADNGDTRGVSGLSQSTSGTGVYGEASAYTGTGCGVRGKTNSTGGYGGYFEGRGYFSGNVGIGVTGPSEKLDTSGTAPARHR